MLAVKEVIDSNDLALLTPLRALGLEVLAWSLMQTLTRTLHHLELQLTTLLPDATGQARPSRELSNSKVTTVSLTAVRGRRLRLRTLEERAFARKCRQKVRFSAPKIASEALEHPPLRSGLLQGRISIDLRLHHELGRPRLGDLLVWIHREFPLRRVMPLPYSRHCTQTALHQWRYGPTVFANGLHSDCSSHLQSSCSVAMR